jgi:hypothetical protein
LIDLNLFVDLNFFFNSFALVFGLSTFIGF